MPTIEIGPGTRRLLDRLSADAGLTPTQIAEVAVLNYADAQLAGGPLVSALDQLPVGEQRRIVLLLFRTLLSDMTRGLTIVEPPGKGPQTDPNAWRRHCVFQVMSIDKLVRRLEDPARGHADADGIADDVVNDWQRKGADGNETVFRALTRGMSYDDVEAATAHLRTEQTAREMAPDA